MRSEKNGIGNLIIGIVGVIVVVFTLATFFLLNFERTTVQWVALAFLLLSEFVLFSGLIGIRSLGSNFSKVFVSAGIGTTLFLYFFATLISVFFANTFDRLNSFIWMQLVIIGIFAIIAVAILAFSRRIAINDEESLNKVGETQPKRGGF